MVYDSFYEKGGIGMLYLEVLGLIFVVVILSCLGAIPGGAQGIFLVHTCGFHPQYLGYHGWLGIEPCLSCVPLGYLLEPST